jgi:hypothetical protein
MPAQFYAKRAFGETHTVGGMILIFARVSHADSLPGNIPENDPFNVTARAGSPVLTISANTRRPST